MKKNFFPKVILVLFLFFAHIFSAFYSYNSVQAEYMSELKFLRLAYEWLPEIFSITFLAVFEGAKHVFVRNFFISKGWNWDKVIHLLAVIFFFGLSCYFAATGGGEIANLGYKEAILESRAELDTKLAELKENKEIQVSEIKKDRENVDILQKERAEKGWGLTDLERTEKIYWNAKIDTIESEYKNREKEIRENSKTMLETALEEKEENGKINIQKSLGIELLIIILTFFLFQGQVRSAQNQTSLHILAHQKITETPLGVINSTINSDIADLAGKKTCGLKVRKNTIEKYATFPLYHEVRELLKAGMSIREVARRTGISLGTVQRIKKVLENRMD